MQGEIILLTEAVSVQVKDLQEVKVQEAILLGVMLQEVILQKDQILTKGQVDLQTMRVSLHLDLRIGLQLDHLVADQAALKAHQTDLQKDLAEVQVEEEETNYCSTINEMGGRDSNLDHPFFIQSYLFITFQSPNNTYHA